MRRTFLISNQEVEQVRNNYSGLLNLFEQDVKIVNQKLMLVAT